MRHPALVCAALMAGVLADGGTNVCAQDVPYSVAPQPWEEGLGSHRARVRVQAAADAVRVHIPWRRRDREPHRKRILVQTSDGRPIRNVVPIRVERESADLVFQPEAGGGGYFIYYLPYTPQGNWGWYGGDYLPPEDTADPDWRRRHGLAPDQLPEGGWRSLPEAEVLGIEARTEFSRCDPMEVIATPQEIHQLLESHPAPYLLFPEDRRRPIRMPDELPLCWIRRGPGGVFQGEAERDEFYCFQIGVYAARQKLENLDVSFADLRPAAGGQPIPASAFRCINLGGTDWTGEPLRKTVDVEQGRVQALWCGVSIPRGAAPGRYEGAVTVRPANAAPQTVPLQLDISPRVAEEHGDNELWRHSRLRWLDSTIALDDEPVRPYTPLRVRGRSVACLGRTLRFGPDGLPASIRAGKQEILAGPVALSVRAGDSTLAWTGKPARITRQSAGVVTWEWGGRSGSIDLSGRAQMEFDGHVLFQVTLKANDAVALDDVALEIPFRREVATYLMGIGRKGGLRPREHSWKWGGRVYYDSFWVGDVHAGLQCELRGANYCGPMVNLYWNLGQLQPPASWHNDGKGGCTVADAGPDRVLARAYSGPRELKPGDEIRFEFALLITPVKPLDTAKHFRTRYYHSYEPLDKIQATGANVVNIHHANELNPYINYPFLAVDKLAAYIRDAHARGMKVKIYYTMRELTNHVVEMWALRSLGHEVLAPGSGGGYPWLREHLVEDYSPAWYQPQPDGDACAAIVNSGASRWYNCYLEGLAWLVKHAEIDGLYNDDVSYDRRIMKRVRKILDRGRPGCLIDLHSNTAFSHGPANQYMEFFPYIDSLWFGESFNYDESPDYWLTEISGIPYGLMGEMLQDGGNPWRGMVYGMVSRMPWSGDPSGMWKVWDEFGIDRARMIGYWEPGCPVRTGRDDVLATAYVRRGKTLISVASWAKTPVRCRLQIDWKALGLDPKRAHLYAPAIPGFQEAALFSPEDEIPIVPRRGWVLIVDHAAHQAPAYEPPKDQAYQSRQLLLEERFAGSELAPEWHAHTSTQPGTRLDVKDGRLSIQAEGHVCAFVERPLPPGVTLVQCRVYTGTDQGMTWGPGIACVWPDRFLRVNVRPTEGRVGIDDGKTQRLVSSFVGADTECWLRLRLEADQVLAEVSPDGEWWEVVHTLPREAFPDHPDAVRVGKMSGDRESRDAGEPSAVGACWVSELRAYGTAR